MNLMNEIRFIILGFIRFIGVVFFEVIYLVFIDVVFVRYIYELGVGVIVGLVGVDRGTDRGFIGILRGRWGR